MWTNLRNLHQRKESQRRKYFNCDAMCDDELVWKEWWWTNKLNKFNLLKVRVLFLFFHIFCYEKIIANIDKLHLHVVSWNQRAQLSLEVTNKGSAIETFISRSKILGTIETYVFRANLLELTDSKPNYLHVYSWMTRLHVSQRTLQHHWNLQLHRSWITIFFVL